MLSLLRRRRTYHSDACPDAKVETSCPQCGGESRFLVSSMDRNRHTTREVFCYFKCQTCSMVFMDPVPADLSPFYEGGYRTIPQNLLELREIAAQERYRMDPILRYKKDGRLLEIGPWMGVFSLNAKDAGFDVTAIEMDRQCVDFLQSTVKVRAIQSYDPAATIADLDQQFDVIALWHCLEHLRDPWIVVQQAAKYLAPGGILLVAIPNIESYEFSLLHADWRNLDAPRHLSFFPPGALRKLCEQQGLKQLELTTVDELSLAFSLESWRILAAKMLPVRYARGALALMMKFLANRRERKKESGPGITAVFQRPVR